ncbi:DUF6385 domain-containing protein [Nocardioidaceae bacterium SCSIO 66511]|nr:DUF6385 domain-containing protein [Nocardioidaceae bacterium SCSIO 66511]
MHTTYTSVLARRIRIDSDYATLPYEAGWASEAVFFTQVEGDHPVLEVSTEVSPDGVNWVRRGDPQTLTADESIVESTLTVFGNWVRLRITGAHEHTPARVLVHLNLKG